MSTQTRKKKTKSKTKEQLKEELKSVAGVDARRDIVRIAVAGVLLLSTLFLCVALISNIFTGAADQSQVIARTTFPAHNKAGLAGAYCAFFLMNKLFGIGALMIPFFLMCVVMKMMILLLSAAPTTCGSSQARCQIGAAASGLCDSQSHSNT